jgi:hypothetical protein
MWIVTPFYVTNMSTWEGFVARVIMTGKSVRNLEGSFRCLIGVLGGCLHWMTWVKPIETSCYPVSWPKCGNLTFRIQAKSGNCCIKIHGASISRVEGVYTGLLRDIRTCVPNGTAKIPKRPYCLTTSSIIIHGVMTPHKAYVCGR